MKRAEARGARWTVEFARTGLSAADIRMLDAIVDGDLRLMRVAEPAEDDREEEALVTRVTDALAARFQSIVFRVVRVEKDAP